MKILQSTLAVLVLSIFSMSCNKDDDSAPTSVDPALAPLQDPLPGYLAATGFNQKTEIIINNIDYELGYSFIPLVNGKMTDIVVKIPDSHIGMRVTVWDKMTGTVLRTESIDMATANVEVIKPITALDLVKDKEYFLSMNTNDYYRHSKTDGANVVYPFTVGDIKITSYSYTDGTAQAIPNNPYFINYAGDCSFKFQK